MSDYNSSLPIRTEGNGDVVVKIADGTTPSQTLAIDAAGKVIAKLADGAGVALTSQVNGAGQALDVGIVVAGVQVDPRQVRALTNADVVTAEQGGVWSVIPTDGVNDQVFTAAGEASVIVSQPLPAGTNNIGEVSIQDSTGAAITVLNPLPVYLASSFGTEVHSYQTNAAIAAAAASNHEYTATAELKLNKVIATASGKAKIEVQRETAAASGIFATFAVSFNSAANPDMEISFNPPLVVAAGVKVRVIRTNKDNQAMDLYSTIMGTEV